MYLVVFRAGIRQLDEAYSAMARQLREIALTEMGCTDFHAMTEDGQEIALSWWPSQEAIQAWHAHPLHQEAQRLGRERWYEWVEVNVTQVLRHHGNRPAAVIGSGQSA